MRPEREPRHEKTETGKRKPAPLPGEMSEACVCLLSTNRYLADFIKSDSNAEKGW